MKQTVQTIIQLMEGFDFEIKVSNENPEHIHFYKDTDMDSLDKVELIMMCEDEFEVPIHDHDVDGIVTVGDLAKYLDKKISSIKPKADEVKN